MKRVFAIIVIAALLVGLATFEQFYFASTLNTMQSQIVELLEDVTRDPEHVDSTQNMAHARDFIDFWGKHKHYYEMLLSHTYTLELERNAAVLYVHMEQNDYLMTTTDLSSLKENCALLREVITPHLHTIL